MSETLSSEVESYEGATVVITHRVRNDKHADYEKWLEEIALLCKASPGYLDWHIVRPIPGLSETYTHITGSVKKGGGGI
jgi:antibiotic biosynthesis monooxygenase (ABM) superfamily enzyme